MGQLDAQEAANRAAVLLVTAQAPDICVQVSQVKQCSCIDYIDVFKICLPFLPNKKGLKHWSQATTQILRHDSHSALVTCLLATCSTCRGLQQELGQESNRKLPMGLQWCKC